MIRYHPLPNCTTVRRLFTLSSLNFQNLSYILHSLVSEMPFASGSLGTFFKLLCHRHKVQVDVK